MKLDHLAKCFLPLLYDTQEWREFIDYMCHESNTDITDLYDRDFDFDPQTVLDLRKYAYFSQIGSYLKLQRAIRFLDPSAEVMYGIVLTPTRYVDWYEPYSYTHDCVLYFSDNITEIFRGGKKTGQYTWESATFDVYLEISDYTSAEPYIVHATPENTVSKVLCDEAQLPGSRIYIEDVLFNSQCKSINKVYLIPCFYDESEGKVMIQNAYTWEGAAPAFKIRTYDKTVQEDSPRLLVGAHDLIDTALEDCDVTYKDRHGNIHTDTVPLTPVVNGCVDVTQFKGTLTGAKFLTLKDVPVRHTCQLNVRPDLKEFPKCTIVKTLDSSLEAAIKKSSDVDSPLSTYNPLNEQLGESVMRELEAMNSGSVYVDDQLTCNYGYFVVPDGHKTTIRIVPDSVLSTCRLEDESGNVLPYNNAVWSVDPGVYFAIIVAENGVEAHTKIGIDAVSAPSNAMVVHVGPAASVVTGPIDIMLPAPVHGALYKVTVDNGTVSKDTVWVSETESDEFMATNKAGQSYKVSCYSAYDPSLDIGPDPDIVYPDLAVAYAQMLGNYTSPLPINDVLHHDDDSASYTHSEPELSKPYKVFIPKAWANHTGSVKLKEWDSSAWVVHNELDLNTDRAFYIGEGAKRQLEITYVGARTHKYTIDLPAMVGEYEQGTFPVKAMLMVGTKLDQSDALPVLELSDLPFNPNLTADREFVVTQKCYWFLRFSEIPSASLGTLSAETTITSNCFMPEKLNGAEYDGATDVQITETNKLYLVGSTLGAYGAAEDLKIKIAIRYILASDNNRVACSAGTVLINPHRSWWKSAELKTNGTSVNLRSRTVLLPWSSDQKDVEYRDGNHCSVYNVSVKAIIRYESMGENLEGYHGVIERTEYPAYSAKLAYDGTNKDFKSEIQGYRTNAKEAAVGRIVPLRNNSTGDVVSVDAHNLSLIIQNSSVQYYSKLDDAYELHIEPLKFNEVPAPGFIGFSNADDMGMWCTLSVMQDCESTRKIQLANYDNPKFSDLLEIISVDDTDYRGRIGNNSLDLPYPHTIKQSTGWVSDSDDADPHHVTISDVPEFYDEDHEEMLVDQMYQFVTFGNQLKGQVLGSQIIPCVNEGVLSANCPSVVMIDAYSFYGCYALKTATFLNCKHIGHNAFTDCVNLESLVIPTCNHIFEDAFVNCKSLHHVEASNLLVIPKGAFAQCSLDFFDFVSVNKVEEGAFGIEEDCWIQSDKFTQMSRIIKSRYHDVLDDNGVPHDEDVTGVIYLPKCSEWSQSFGTGGGWPSKGYYQFGLDLPACKKFGTANGTTVYTPDLSGINPSKGITCQIVYEPGQDICGFEWNRREAVEGCNAFHYWYEDIQYIQWIQSAYGVVVPIGDTAFVSLQVKLDSCKLDEVEWEVTQIPRGASVSVETTSGVPMLKISDVTTTSTLPMKVVARYGDYESPAAVVTVRF